MTWLIDFLLYCIRCEFSVLSSVKTRNQVFEKKGPLVYLFIYLWFLMIITLLSCYRTYMISISGRGGVALLIWKVHIWDMNFG